MAQVKSLDELPLDDFARWQIVSLDDLKKSLQEKLDIGNYGEYTVWKIQNLLDAVVTLEGRLQNAIKPRHATMESLTKNVQSLLDLDGLLLQREGDELLSELDNERELVDEEFDWFDTSNFKLEALPSIEEINQEISSTSKILQTKGKEIASKVQKEVTDTAERMEKSIQDNIEIVENKRDEAKREKAKIKKNPESYDRDFFSVEGDEIEEPSKKKEKSKPVSKEAKSKKKSILKKKDKSKEIPKETKLSKEELLDRKKKKYKKLKKQLVEQEKRAENAMIEYEENGFVETFKRLWKNREVKSNGKKQGFFSVLWDALFQASDSKDYRRDQKEVAKLANKRIDELDNEIAKCEKEIRGLSKQKTAIKHSFVNLGETAIKTTRGVLDKSLTPPSPIDINSKRLTSITSKVSKMAEKSNKDNTKWKDKMTSKISSLLGPIAEARLEKINSNIEDVDRLVEELWGEYQDIASLESARYSAYQNATSEVFNLKKDDYVEEKLGKKVIKGISKVQHMIANARFKKKAKELERANNKKEKLEDKQKKYEAFSRRSSRNEGMDR